MTETEIIYKRTMIFQLHLLIKFTLIQPEGAKMKRAAVTLLEVDCAVATGMAVNVYILNFEATVHLC